MNSLLAFAGDEDVVENLIAGARRATTFPALRKWALATHATRAGLSAEQNAEIAAAVMAHKRDLQLAQASAEFAAAADEAECRKVGRSWAAEIEGWSEADKARFRAAYTKHLNALIGIMEDL